MLPLKQFSIAVLSAKSVRQVDVQLSMSLGENYAKKLVQFVESNFDYVDFVCEDNGIAKELRLISADGCTSAISIVSDAIKNNVIQIHKADLHLLESFNSYEQFTDILDKLSLSLCEKSAQDFTIAPST